MSAKVSRNPTVPPMRPTVMAPDPRKAEGACEGREARRGGVVDVGVGVGVGVPLP